MKPRILIVDDEVDLVQLLEQVFEQNGFETHRALSGEDAVTQAEEVMPDLILLDIMMPGMDGWQTLRILRGSKETADIPVVMLTARTDPQAQWEGWKRGAVDYITKPFTIPDLVKRVQEIVTQVKEANG